MSDVEDADGSKDAMPGSTAVPTPGSTPGSASEPASNRALSAAAKRALAEAAQRRQERDAARDGSDQVREINGRGGLDPARYGDWEVKGLTSDF